MEYKRCQIIFCASPKCFWKEEVLCFPKSCLQVSFLNVDIHMGVGWGKFVSWEFAKAQLIIY